jgi:hypothetical protein
MGFVSRSRRRRVFSVFAAFALLSMLAIGPRGALALIQQIGDSPSPATGHAEVIAQGVSALPSDSALWRVSQSTATSLENGQPDNVSLGFTVATDGGILVNDYTSGLQQRLSNGEAAFSESGAFQQHASLSGSDAQYLRIGLVNDGSGDGVVYASDAFSPPGGLRDIDLVRDVLNEGEATTINAGSAPSLIYVTAGEVTVDDGSNTTTLQAGQGMTVGGEVDIQSTSGQSTMLAAVIGNEVPAPPRISGTVTLDVRACPAGVTAEQLQTEVTAGTTDTLDSCTALADPSRAGLEIDLKPADGDALPLKDADLTDENGVVTWNAVPFGDYTLGEITAYPDGYGDSVMSDGNLNIGDHSAFTLNRDNPDVYRVIYLLPSANADGSIEVTYYTCHVASIDDFDPDTCTSYVGEVPTELTVNGAEAPLTLADAERGENGGNDYIWSDLAVADNEDPTGSDPGYYLLSTELENVDPTPQLEVDGAEFNDAAGAYEVKLTPEHPQATVSFYSINIVPDTTGTIYLVGAVCPSAGAETTECDTNGNTQLVAVTIAAASGESINQDAASTSGDAYLWSDLPLDTYTVSAENIVAPDGYEVRTILHYQTGDSGDTLDATLSIESPAADFVVYLDPIGDDSGTPVDTDSDGLSDDDEAVAGTDAANADSDSDCYSDGSEVAASTDPLDAASFPDGDCDI